MILLFNIIQLIGLFMLQIQLKNFFYYYPVFQLFLTFLFNSRD